MKSVDNIRFGDILAEKETNMFTRLILILFLCISNAHANDKCLIIANGPFDKKLVKDIIAQEHPIIVALDGAANNLIIADVMPDYILGDFDSILENTQTYFRSKNVKFVSTPDQDYTDLEKGVIFCKERGVKQIAITCALGGERTDHSFANLSLLRRYHNTKIQIRTPGEIIEFLKNETVEFEGAKGEKFGLFGFPKAVASSKGLMWELDNYQLELGYKESSCNVLQDRKIKISVKGEALMIRPGL